MFTRPILLAAAGTAVTAAAALALLPQVATTATGPETVTFEALAAQHCPAEWSALAAHAPPAWGGLDPIEIDPNLAPAVTQAWNRYAVAVVALAQVVRDFVAVGSDNPAERPDFALATARLDLAECLMPTEAQRATIVAFAMDQRALSEAQANEALFRGFDDFACMGMAPASRAILALDPSSDTYMQDHVEITERLMTPCP